MSTAPKRCLYEVLDLPQFCTRDEIRSAYRKLALQRHPDKLVQSGMSSAEATAAFQELLHAYEVLSDPKERQWYDSHRSQILFSDLSSSDASSLSGIPNLFPYFSPSCYTDYTDPKKGFYKVYGDVFDRIVANEVRYVKTLGLGLGVVKEAPLMGDLKSPYAQVNAFYGYWLGFGTVMDFGWLDKWNASAGENRKVRRLMDEENKKMRKKAKKEFNETVRGLAEFVKKRDKRVIDMIVMKEKESERKRKEEMERRKRIEREKLEKARMYKEPEWAQVREDEVEEGEEEEDEEEERKEWYCAACGKKFKSDKQWKNHEQSRKHKEKVAELKAAFAEEDEEFEDVESDEVDGEEFVGQNEEVEGDVGDDGFQSAEEDVSDLGEEFRDGVTIEEEENGGESSPGTDDNDVEELIKEELKEELSNQEEESGGELLSGTEDNNVEEPNGEENSIESDDEISVLKAMMSGHKIKKRGTVKRQPKPHSTSEVHIDSENEEEVVMEYNNRKKSIRKSRRAKGGKGKKSEEATMEANGDNNAKSHNEENGVQNDAQACDGGIKSEENLEDDVNYKGSKGDRFTKGKKSSRSTKQKGKTKQSEPVCEKCGEEFESRSKLHKHLMDTGHALVKSR